MCSYYLCEWFRWFCGLKHFTEMGCGFYQRGGKLDEPMLSDAKDDGASVIPTLSDSQDEGEFHTLTSSGAQNDCEFHALTSSDAHDCRESITPTSSDARDDGEPDALTSSDTHKNDAFQTPFIWKPLITNELDTFLGFHLGGWGRIYTLPPGRETDGA